MCEAAQSWKPMRASLQRWRKVALIAGGSYNPPTYMHLRMFELARDYLQHHCSCQVVQGIVSPVSDSFDKPDLLGASHRVKMLDLAVQSSDWIRVDGWETKREGWSRTVEVLEHFSSQLTEASSSGDSAHLMLLCGGDLVKSFSVPNLWKAQDIETIVRDYGLVVLQRSGSDPQSYIQESDILFKYRSNIHIISDWTNPNDVSSTKIRTALRRKESVKYLLDDAVLEYILLNGLYQHPPDVPTCPSSQDPEPPPRPPSEGKSSCSQSPAPVWNAQAPPEDQSSGLESGSASPVARATVRGRDVAAYLSPYDSSSLPHKRVIKHRSVSSEFRPKPLPVDPGRSSDDSELSRPAVTTSSSSAESTNLHKTAPLSISNPCVVNNVALRLKGFKLSPTPETTV